MFDIGGLISSFGGLAWTLLFFVVALSIIVAVHEYGHYIVGRWSGIHAEVFSIGFGPVLFGKTDRHGTYWQVAALPLGGYVKFKGDANAASGPDIDGVNAMSAAERRTTMHGAPLWARAATAAAGPVFNFVFSILLFAVLFMVQGTYADRLTINALAPLPGAFEIQEGDEIVAIDGRTVSGFAGFNEIAVGLPASGQIDYTVDRNGDRLVVTGPYPYPPLASAVNPQSAAIDAGLKAGDVVTAVNGQGINTFSELQYAVAQADGGALTLDLWRDGTEFTTDLTPRRVDIPRPDGGFDQRWLIGISGGLFFEPDTERLGPWRAVTAATERTGDIITSSLSGMYHMITGAISACNLSGPVTIAETSGQMATMGTITFLSFIAVLSTAIGLMNLFPIPMLDGGHLVFYAYEAITGKTPSDRAYQFLMAIGFSCVMTLMFFALATDIFCP